MVRYIDENYDGDELTVYETPPSGYLTLLIDGQPSHSFPLRGEVTLGRDKSNSVVTADQKISRHHATLSPIDNTFLLQDQGSANGTYLNGVLIGQPTRLKDNDKINFGDTTFLFSKEHPAPDAIYPDVIQASAKSAPQPVIHPPSNSANLPQVGQMPVWATIGCMGLVIITLLVIIAMLLGIFVGQNQVGLILLPH